MDKEKEIQEMADIAETYCSNHWDGEVCEDPYKSDCDKCTLSALTEAGYRKADEVRKETAEDVLLCIMCSHIPNKYGTFSPEWEVLQEVLSDINSLITEKYSLRGVDE